MPIDVTFDEDLLLLHVKITGAWPTLPEIVAERSRQILAGVIRPGVVELVDARDITRGIPNLSQMQGILHAIGKPPHKRALVVNSDIGFNAGRLAELLDPKGVKVFRDEAAAREWLLQAKPAEEPVTFDRSRSGRIAVVRKR